MDMIQKKELTPMVQYKDSYKLIVTKEFQKKVKTIGARWPHNEWSGTLFYTIEGTFEDNNLVVIAKDFYLQDKGVSTFTEFGNDPTLVTYMIDNDLLDCHQGLVHCHPTFATNPSGTDINTINEEGDERNHFVSLIVSNVYPYSARITRKIKKDIKLISTEEWSYKTWGDELVEFEPFTDETTETKYIIEAYPLDIEVENVEIERDELQLRMDELDSSSKSYANRTNPYGFNTDSKYGYPMSDKLPLWTPSKEDKEDNKQLTLFPEFEKASTSNDNVIKDELIELVEKHFNFIITGDIFSSLKAKNPKTPDYLKNYIKNMESLYKKRFNFKIDFELFADAILEYCYEDVLNNTYNIAATEGFDDGGYIASWVESLTEKLNTVNNDFVEYYKLKLTQYV